MSLSNIAILFGGMSAEYKVSLQSAQAVIRHLDPGKYSPIPVGITREGRWLRFRGDSSHIAEDTWHSPHNCTPAILSPCRSHGGLLELHSDGSIRPVPLDAAFPVLHGRFGEDGTVQGLLELAGIPIVGCGTLASALCMDKHLAHTVAEAAGIAVPKSYVFPMSEKMRSIYAAATALGYPLFVKPVCAGSSFGVSRVESEQDLAAAVGAALRHDTRFLLEEAIDGFEVGCAILGNEHLIAGEVDEVELSGGFFDYTEKYNLITSRIHVPARIPVEQAGVIKKMAMSIYRALGCQGFARVDLFLQPSGRVVFNEVNTIPGFTAHSRYPSMMSRAGLTFAELIGKLIEAAVTRNERHKNKDISPDQRADAQRSADSCQWGSRGYRAVGFSADAGGK